MGNLTEFHLDCHKLFDGVKLFPIEMDLARSAFQTQDHVNVYEDHQDSLAREYHDEVEQAEEATSKANDDDKMLNLDTTETETLTTDKGDENFQLLSGLTAQSSLEQQNGNLLDF